MSAVSAGMVAERPGGDRSRGRPGQRRGRSRASGVRPLHDHYKSASDRQAAERERLLCPLLHDLDALAGTALAALRTRPAGLRRSGGAVPPGRPRPAAEKLRRPVNALLEGRLPTAEELTFHRGASMRRAQAAFAMEDYLSTYRVAQQVLWDAIVAHADRTGTDHHLVLKLAAELMRDMDVVTTHAGRTYAEFREHASAAVAEQRRDLLEQLLRGALPTDGPLAAAADRCGIGAGTPALVAVAVPLAAGSDRDAAELASATFAGVGLQEPSALIVIRRHQLVAVVSLIGQSDPERLCVRLDQAHERLRNEGAPMAIGVSAIARGVGELPAAHDEAMSAVRFVGKSGGVFALTRVSLMDYLALSARRDRAPPDRAAHPDVPRRGHTPRRHARRDASRVRAVKPQPQARRGTAAHASEHAELSPSTRRGGDRPQSEAVRGPPRSAGRHRGQRAEQGRLQRCFTA